MEKPRMRRVHSPLGRSNLVALCGALLLAAGCETTSDGDETVTLPGADAQTGLPPVVGDGGQNVPVLPGGGGTQTGGGGTQTGAGGEGSGGASAGGENGGRGPYCREGIEDVCGDDFDNNCNGRVDEGCTCTGPEKPCYTGDPRDLEVENGQCRQGTQACELEFYGDCTGEVRPSAEVCDGLDNDCNGETDEIEDCTNTPPIAVCPPDQTGPTLANYDVHGEYQDPDGDEMASALWTLVSTPGGSTAVPMPADALDTRVFADLQGPYTLELTVTDVRGGVGRCETHVTTTSDDQLRIEMVWNVGADGDMSDVDMHLKRSAGATWFDSDDAGDDCYFANCRVCDAGIEDECRNQIAEYNADPNNPPPPQVEWTPPLDDDDPRLDLDDVEGGGPENINIRTPSNGTYRLGVHYWDADGFGASTVSLRVFCAGRVAAEIGPVVLQDAGIAGDPDTEFWEVGDIVWRGGDCEFQAFGSQACPQICSQGEAESFGCPAGLSRGQACN
jgi:hypothetical protein